MLSNVCLRLSAQCCRMVRLARYPLLQYELSNSKRSLLGYLKMNDKFFAMNSFHVSLVFFSMRTPSDTQSVVCFPFCVVDNMAMIEEEPTFKSSNHQQPKEANSYINYERSTQQYTNEAATKAILISSIPSYSSDYHDVVVIIWLVLPVRFVPNIGLRINYYCRCLPISR